MKDNSELCSALITARLAKSFTQKDAAKIAGVSVKTIRSMEHGARNTRIETVIVLWKAYELYCETQLHKETTDVSIMQTDINKLSDVLICGRKAKGYTVEDAAEIAEVTVETIRNMEHKRNDIRIGTLMILWDAYGLRRDGIMNYYVRTPTTDEIIKQIDKKYAQRRELKEIM